MKEDEEKGTEFMYGSSTCIGQRNGGDGRYADFEGASTRKNVTGKYTQIEPATVYKVDVKWGSMDFTYQGADTVRHWNPETHEYQEALEGTGKWLFFNEGDNAITVTNYSNKAITATITAKIETEGIKADILDPVIRLEDASKGASETTAGTASSGTAKVSLSGDLDKTTTANTKIGTVTIAFADTDTTTEQP